MVMWTIRNSTTMTSKDQLHINPQIKYNLQEALGIDNRIEVGMEYSYWKNKYGTEFPQNTPSALVKLTIKYYYRFNPLGLFFV